MKCQLDDLEVHYVSLGEGRPIVFIHGWSMDHHVELADYEPIFGRRAGWQRIYFDLPGMGVTPTRDWITDQDRIVDVVLGFIDQVVAGRRFVLAGTSLGAYLACAVLHKRGRDIDGLMLRVPCLVPDDSKRTRPAFRPLIEDAQLMAWLGAAEAAELGEILVQSHDYIEALRDKLRNRVQPAERAAASICADIRRDPARYALSFDVNALPEPFNPPTLIMAGRQDTSVGYRDAWSVLENFPRATFAVLDRADHGFPLDQKRLFAALVEDWLDRVEEALGGVDR
ncbi:Pimeloyl-ACP methyl ester carboxylesterase [Rhizobiales bacterium GAS191]|jgi:pimeloyl-ACP methyl ester carboxylesterase|nr:Pimeloyl-ACP methyl ester carboxylesterase [Rhizobiales bacterium GAS113]SEE96268.1 Pimeloyl-ACP methyl ester carboxylesterase [Rhizobiales bacterium GAS191]